MPVVWSDCLTVNIEELDLQHAQLIELVNILSCKKTEAAGKSCLLEHIDRLIHFAKYHFATEEQYFGHLNHPWVEEHKQEHAALLSQILSLRTAFVEDRIGLTANVTRILEDWVLDHIFCLDLQHAPSFEKDAHAIFDVLKPAVSPEIPWAVM